MKFAYAFRRGTFYPFIAGAAWDIPSAPKTRAEYLGKVNIDAEVVDRANKPTLRREFAGRRNLRPLDTSARMKLIVAKAAGKRLRCADLTAP